METNNFDQIIEKIKNDSREKHIPILMDDTLEVIEKNIKNQIENQIKNNIEIKDENYTYRILEIGTAVGYSASRFVNMVGVESKLIQEGDRIELGTGHYVLDWNIIKSFVPKYADIRPLKKVWEDYQNELMDLNIKERRFGHLRSATGLITTAAVILGFVTGRDNPLFIILYVVAGVISAYFFFKAYSECDKTPKRIQEIKEAFPHKYVCPNCGHFLDNRSYDILVQDGKCRHCQAIFKK